MIINEVISILNDYIFYFIIYSLLGWIIESLYISIKYNKIMGSGLLYLPFAPIYGFGSFFLILISSFFKDNLILCLILIVLITSNFEYFSASLLEKLFKAKLWDYKDELLNINGRISLKHSMAWLILGYLLIYYFHPLITELKDTYTQSNVSYLLYGLIIIIIIDFILSSKRIKKIKNPKGKTFVELIYFSKQRRHE